MKIAVDAMGSDSRPINDIAGAVEAARAFGIGIILVGPEVMPPAAPAIADKALDGKLARELHWPHP